MEVYMKNISFNATKHEIHLEIAKVLHSPDYQRYSTIPLNFSIVLFPDKRGYRHHGGSGSLTLPTSDVGQHFLSDYGSLASKPIFLYNRRIVFEKSRKGPRLEVVNNITNHPYLNPVALAERERRAARLRSQTVSIRTVQFGWECRDKVFSVEWEKSCEAPCHLMFVEDRRELRIKFFEISQTLVIAIGFSSIHWTGVSNFDEPTVFFSLTTPPAFESELPPDQLDQLLRRQGPRFKGSVYDIAPRQRLSCLDEEHGRVAPYTSLALRLVCSSRVDTSTFHELSKVKQLAAPNDFGYPVERRRLFSRDVMEEYAAWLQSLDWSVAFQVEALTRGLVVDIREMMDLRSSIENVVQVHGADYTSGLLRHFEGQAQELFWRSEENEGIEETIQQCLLRSQREFGDQKRSVVRAVPIPQNVFQCLHVIVTPTTILLEGPFPERSNRVMRWYPDHHHRFLRVSFVEESRLQYRWDRQVNGADFVRRRVGVILHDGLSVAGRWFKFLAYSQSALKEHAVWFIMPFHDTNGYVDVPTIISRIGSFDRQLMLCPARYGARISQAFTATDESITVEAEEIMYGVDVKRNGSVFTDGVGTMSPELALAIWTELGRRKRRRARGRQRQVYPRAFQIRLMGCKGMLSVDYRLTGRTIYLRPSMIKFEALDSRDVEIARAFDRPGNYFLNRPLIMLLEGLGVPYKVFKDLQDAAVQQAQDSSESLDTAARLLEAYGLGGSYRLTSVMLNLSKLQLGTLDDIFYEQMMEFAINHVLRELKHHARIPVPGDNSWTLVGVADVHGFLKEGEIFACIRPTSSSSNIYLEGQAVVSRSPTIHPGDVQLVRAIGPPPPGSPFAREPLPNTIVFSTKGARSLPSCLGGGDLDGDLYNVTTMPCLLSKWTYEPASYESAPRKELDRPSNIHDVADFVVDYINSDVLGIIAINWLIIADQSTEGILDPDCLLLAQLHSDAVDYPKSGQPVPLDKIPKLKRREKPDWNAPETIREGTADYYESRRAIGRLYRAIELSALRSARKALTAQRRQLRKENMDLEDLFESMRLKDVEEDTPMAEALRSHVSEYIDLELDEDLISSTWTVFQRYASELHTICAAHTLSHNRSVMLTEEEAVVGTIVANTSQPRKRKDLISKLREQTAFLVNDIRDELLGEDISLEEQLERAWTAWKVADSHNSFGSKSFGWIALGLIFETVKVFQDEERNF